VLKLLEKTDAFRRPDRFADMLVACEADARGRSGLEDRPYPQAAYLRHALQTAAAVTLTGEDRQGLTGPAIGEKLRTKRIAALESL
jgi:tRNA nucleotidyltransferase (CCA-adding enzyme)